MLQCFAFLCKVPSEPFNLQIEHNQQQARHIDCTSESIRLRSSAFCATNLLRKPISVSSLVSRTWCTHNQLIKLAARCVVLGCGAIRVRARCVVLGCGAIRVRARCVVLGCVAIRVRVRCVVLGCVAMLVRELAPPSMCRPPAPGLLSVVLTGASAARTV